MCIHPGAQGKVNKKCRFPPNHFIGVGWAVTTAVCKGHQGQKRGHTDTKKFRKFCPKKHNTIWPENTEESNSEGRKQEKINYINN